MKAITAADRSAESARLTLADIAEPAPAINDVMVEVHASGFVPAEWTWPSTWVDRSGHERSRPVIGHEFAGVVAALGCGTTGLSLGPRVLDSGANEFLDLDSERIEDIGGVDLVFDLIGSDVQRRSAHVIRPGGTLVSIVGPVETRPVDGLAMDFVVESVPAQLTPRVTIDGRRGTMSCGAVLGGPVSGAVTGR